MSELKSCPHCGSKSIKIKIHHYNSNEFFYGYCVPCGSQSEKILDKQKAIEAWNTRAIESELLEAIEEITKAIEKSAYKILSPLGISDRMYMQACDAIKRAKEE